MWDIITHVIIGIFIGWYLMPFKDGSAFRGRVNAMLTNLFRGMVNAMQKNVKTEKATVKEVKEVKETKQTASGKSCVKCGTGLMPLGGEYKGYWFCPSCKGMETAK